MIKPAVISAFTQAALAAKEAGWLRFDCLPGFTVERPANPALGDLSINLALVLAGEAKVSPRHAAQVLFDAVQLPENLVERMEIAGSGCINLYLHPAWLHETVREIHRLGDDYGRSDAGQSTPVLVEFVSANPNSQLSLQHGRGAIFGDVLCAVLEAAGFAVSREFYVNDAAAGTQMVRFGESLMVRYLQELGQPITFPADGYYGEYLIDFAREIIARAGDAYLHLPPAERLELFTTLGTEAMVARQREELARLGVEFDTWFLESALFAQGEVEHTLERLAERGESYRTDGAVRLATTRYGDDMDRPLVRTNGKPTYLASDIAYHRHKFERGFQILIDIWGPDHHGYIARTKAAMAALGFDPDAVRVLIYQPVHLTRAGERVPDSERKGDIVLLSELLEQIGPGAARFCFLLAGADSDLPLDLDLVLSATPDNPVYLVHSARARLEDILRAAETQGIALPDPLATDLTPLNEEAELALIRCLADFPDELRAAAELYEPHRLAQYAQHLARAIHLAADDCPPLTDDIADATRRARLLLFIAAQITLRRAFALLGLAPTPPVAVHDDPRVDKS